MSHLKQPPKAVIAKHKSPSGQPALLSRAGEQAEPAISVTRGSTLPDLYLPGNLLLSRSTLPATLKRTRSLDAGARRASSSSIALDLSEGSEGRRSLQEDRPEDVSGNSSFLDLFVGKGLSRRNAVDKVQYHSTQDLNKEAQEPQITSSTPKPFYTLPALSSPTTWWSSITGSANAEDKEKSDISENMLEEHDQSNADEPVWARIKDKYEKPKYPLVFVHGLFGFDKIGPPDLPILQISYWRGVAEAFEAAGVEVLITKVPASASVEERARALCDVIAEKLPGREVNLIGHSMGGLDSRFLVSQLKPTTFKVRSITTIASPHRGSAFADYIMDEWLGRHNLPFLLNLLGNLGVPGGGKAFDDLTTTKMAKFNAATPDDPKVKYYSYGARCQPGIFDSFRPSWRVIYDEEGDNDGLVSIESAKWGSYIGTLENVNHLDLVGWVGAIRYKFAEWKGNPIQYKPVSFYLSVSEMLSKEGL